MGLFQNIGCATNGPCREKKALCEGWFASDPALMKQCKELAKATKGGRPFSRDDFLNSIGIGPEQQAAQAALDQQSQESIRKNLTLIAKIGAVIGFIVIAIIVVKKMK